MNGLPRAALTILLLYVAVVILYAFVGVQSFWGLLLAPLVLLRSVVWRVGLNRILALFLLAGVPILLRRRGRAYLRQVGRRAGARADLVWSEVKRLWSHLPAWIQAFVGSILVVGVIAVAVLSGFVLWLIAFLPFIAKTAIGLAIIRQLAHLATAHGVREISPFLWRALPHGPRDWLERRYRHLWWWTMRRIVRNRRRVVRGLGRLRRRPAAG